MNVKSLKFLLSCSALLSFGLCSAQNSLLIRPQDLRLVPEYSSPDAVSDEFDRISGYHLYIRAVPGVESVMLTETTKDPEGKSDNYAYRALEYNEINGDEPRILDGKRLDSEHARFSLIDSSAESDSIFGRAFHIYIPAEIQFGYPWTRNGTVKIGRGTFLNIRAFSKKYADYSGDFYDNPYMFDLEQKNVRKTPVKKEVSVGATEEEIRRTEEDTPVLTDDYSPAASEKFSEFSDILIYSKGPDSIVDDIMKSLMEISPKTKADVVFVIDATGSMKDDIEKLRMEWIPRLIEEYKEFGSLRLGLLLYRDYVDSYRYKNIPVKFFDFTSDISEFAKNLNSFTIRGNEGGDIPEAVYEALYGGLEFYKWDSSAERKIILIGDAEPHPTPRGTGKYTKELVMKLSARKNIRIDAIITPDEKSRRGR